MNALPNSRSLPLGECFAGCCPSSRMEMPSRFKPNRILFNFGDQHRMNCECRQFGNGVLAIASGSEIKAIRFKMDARGGEIAETNFDAAHGNRFLAERDF